MKQLRLLFVALLFPMLSQAQVGLTSSSILNIDFGVKAGANFAKLSGDTWDNGYKAGFLGGVYGSIHTRKIGVQAEVFFSQARYTTNGKAFYDVYKGVPGFLKNASDTLQNGTVGASYLNIPILLHYKLLSNAWIQVGPQYSMLLSVNDKDELMNDAKQIFKSGDLSAVIGVWINLPAGLNVGARYVMGLSNMDKTTLSNSWKNRTIQLHLGYTIF